MKLLGVFLLAVGLSMDAFASAVCKGISAPRQRLTDAVKVGVFFGIFQALMPLFGYLAVSRLRALIEAVDHWIAFCMLGWIGAHMILESRHDEQTREKQQNAFSAAVLLPLAIATSIDAMAAGIAMALHPIGGSIYRNVFLIGCVTFVFSVVGVRLGNRIGKRFCAKAEVAGGVVLLAMGLRILLCDLGLIG